VARIFHGLSTPTYPIQHWKKCGVWGQFTAWDFTSIVEVRQTSGSKQCTALEGRMGCLCSCAVRCQRFGTGILSKILCSCWRQTLQWHCIVLLKSGSHCERILTHIHGNLVSIIRCIQVTRFFYMPSAALLCTLLQVRPSFCQQSNSLLEPQTLYMRASKLQFSRRKTALVVG
jgi:hypothetical protein